MKTSRKFEIEWQQYKTFFKTELPAKTRQQMEEKMYYVEEVYFGLFVNRSQELAYNVINWLNGLRISIQDQDRREVIDLTLQEINTHWEESGASISGDPEPEASFSYQAILDFIQRPSDLYRHVTGNQSYSWELHFANMTQNLDMLIKWLGNAYAHNDGIDFVYHCYDAANEFNKRIPTKIDRRMEKLEDLRRKQPELRKEGKGHKFLFGT